MFYTHCRKSGLHTYNIKLKRIEKGDMWAKKMTDNNFIVALIHVTRTDVLNKCVDVQKDRTL